MSQNACPYVFPHTTKNHKKGDICNNPIRKKGRPLCWYHIETLKPSNTEIKEIKEEDNSKDEIIDMKQTFIQLENS